MKKDEMKELFLDYYLEGNYYVSRDNMRYVLDYHLARNYRDSDIANQFKAFVAGFNIGVKNE